MSVCITIYTDIQYVSVCVYQYVCMYVTGIYNRKCILRNDVIPRVVQTSYMDNSLLGRVV